MTKIDTFEPYNESEKKEVKRVDIYKPDGICKYYL